MKNFAKIAAVSAILSVGNIEAKNIERTDAMHCASTDLQNLAKNILMNDTRTDVLQNVSTHRVSTATATKTADFIKSRENLETEPPSIKEIIAQAKDLKGEALVGYLEENDITKEYLQEKADEEEEKWRQYNKMWINRETEIHNYNHSHSEEYKIDVDTDDELLSLDKSRNFHEEQRRNLAVIIKAYVQQKSIPTAEDFAEKPSTIDKKSPAIVKWEKKYEMEIVDKEGRIYVYHNGEKVSSLLFPGFYKGKPTLNLTKDGKMVFTYADKEKENNITIYIPENGGMTEKSEDSEDQLYKFTKPTLAQN